VKSTVKLAQRNEPDLWRLFSGGQISRADYNHAAGLPSPHFLVEVECEAVWQW
jgi:hypothetical protein